MRRNIFLVLVVLSLFLTSSISYFAQGNNVQSEEIKQEKLELQAFINEFAKSYEHKKDLDKIPSRFFASNFKDIFAKNKRWTPNDEIYNQLIEAERFEDNKIIVDLLNLAFIVLSHKFEDVDNIKNSEEISKVLLPSTIKAVEKSRWFKWVLEERDEFEKPKNKEEWHSLIKDAKKILEELPKEINDSPQEKANYKRNFDKWNNEMSDFSFYVCKEAECFGLPTESKIYNVYFNLLELKVVKIDGQLKIINIFFSLIYN